MKFSEAFWPRQYIGISLPNASDIFIPNFINYAAFWDQPILTAYLGGDKAKQIESLSDEEIIGNVTQELREFFYDRTIKLEKYIITRWAEDSLSFGSYSYIPVGSSGENYDVLAMEIDNQLFFAGEATNRQFPASVHGAYLSGIREAGKIIKLFS